jgi:hypothetical protein
MLYINISERRLIKANLQNLDRRIVSPFNRPEVIHTFRIQRAVWCKLPTGSSRNNNLFFDLVLPAQGRANNKELRFPSEDNSYETAHLAVRLVRVVCVFFTWWKLYLTKVKH